ncbi:hypothetical protein GCM10023189_16380 [Nibrella saemangeumensis]|uniref:histidine kinase n=1 Tax=Nibrella saemangeumensis TaxID=1084526 RepID=A0ABP8MPB4_9BACT
MQLSDDDLLAPLASLADFLAARRDALLNNWRTVCEKDPALQHTPALSREEFNNKVPFMLNVLEQHLRRENEEADISQLAAEHGLHRWQKGYSLHELLREMKLLHQVLLAELRLFWELYPPQGISLSATAYEQMAWFSGLTMDASVAQYSDLQRIAANSRAETLQKTLDQINELTQERGDLLRQSAHDLRSSFGVIQGAAFLLKLEGDSTQMRDDMIEMLNRNLTVVRTMVTQLMDLARLEAGQEPTNIQSFNVSELLQSVVDSLQPLAQEQNLLLKADGPDEIMLESDAVHLQRILQNLVLNAVKHTKKGMVSVSWSRENDYRCIISVQDTGPGLQYREEGSLSQVLFPSPDTPSAFGSGLPPVSEQEEQALQASSHFPGKGEGIGLSIVKRLCELLKASLEIESKSETGTLFRIRIPIHWPA